MSIFTDQEWKKMRDGEMPTPFGVKCALLQMTGKQPRSVRLDEDRGVIVVDHEDESFELAVVEHGNADKSAGIKQLIRAAAKKIK